jgi:hypothetical protein
MIRHPRCVCNEFETFTTTLMYASIKILKDNLSNHPELGSKLSLLCKKVREEIDACVYTPDPGLLMTFLKLLKEHKVNYETVYEVPKKMTPPNSKGN